MTTADDLLTMKPDKQVSARAFGVESDMKVPAFSRKTEYVPDIDDAYRFDPQTTLAILAGFAFNRRVMVQGYHGTGKSTHVEQVAARLNWPLVRINLDSHVSRIDLVGKDAIVLKEGKQVTARAVEAAFDCRAIAPVSVMFQQARRRHGSHNLGGAVGGAIVHDDNFKRTDAHLLQAALDRADPLHDVGDALFFIQRGNDDREHMGVAIGGPRVQRG